MLPKGDAFLRTILGQPSSPFREMHVIAALTRELKTAGVPHFLDPIGNIVVGVASQAEYLKLVREKSKDPVRVFIAHTDHPGFHGTRWRTPSQLEMKWHGGSPTQHLDGATVWIADKNGWVGEGRLRDVKMIAGGRAIDTAIVEVSGISSRKAPLLFGGLSFRANWWEVGDLMYTKAADDLVGSYAVATLAKELFAAKKGKKSLPFIGLLTRAEEVGYIGAIGHFELGWLQSAKRPIVCVSLETSRALPGAEIGKGPVVRLGDKFGVFHAGALRVFTKLAQGVLPNRHQKRVMDGGTCEGTTAMVYGFPTVGISVPLGNYHNQSFEGGPDSAGPLGPAPEFVHLGDVAGLLELCRALMTPKLDWTTPFAAKLQEFRKELKSYRPLLKM